jgi:hypothetical protein
MNVRGSIFLLLAGCCLFSAGCRRQAAIPADSFHMTVESVISNNDIIVSVLKISVPRAATISVNCNEGNGSGFSAMSVLPIASGGLMRNGQVALSASRTARQGEKFASIQTSVFSDVITDYQVPVATKLGAYFAISAVDGDYTLDTPHEIGRLDGKPVMMMVGEAPKATGSLSVGSFQFIGPKTTVRQVFATYNGDLTRLSCP